MLYLYTYSASNYTLTGSIDLNPLATSTIQAMTINKFGSNYYAIIGAYFSGNYITTNLSLTSALILIVNQSPPIITPHATSYLSKSG